MRQQIIILLALALSSPSFSAERIISVEGSGTIEVVPDIIRISYEIVSIHKNSSAKAKAEVDEISNNSVTNLIEVGLYEEDITSSSLNVETAEEYDENNNAITIGHAVKRDIDIIVRDISLYDKVVQSLIDSRVSTISSIKPDISNFEELKQRALAKAAADAKGNAVFLAHQFGASLGMVHQIGKQNIRRQFSLEEVIVTARKRASSNVKNTIYEFKPGRVTVSSKVYVEFQLK